MANMPLYAIGEKEPIIDEEAFVHPDAVIIGDVTIGPEATVWPGAVLRGDRGAIRVGAATSIQDGTVVHCTSTLDTVIGEYCVVGHRVHLEGCTIEDDALIGSGSVVLHNVVIGSGALVGAQALVTNGTHVPPLAMALGVPARIRENAVEPGAHRAGADVYVDNGHWFAREMRRLD